MADVWEKDLAQKSSLTTADYIRVVGSDNVSYKQGMKSVADAIRTVVSTQDLNTATKNGEIYQYGIDAENRPVDIAYGYVFVTCQDSNGTNCHQLAVDRGGSARGIVCSRSRINSTWSDWIKMPTRAEVDSLNNRFITAECRTNGSFDLPIEEDKHYLITMMTSADTTARAILISRKNTFVALTELGAGSWQTYYTETLSNNTWHITCNYNTTIKIVVL